MATFKELVRDDIDNIILNMEEFGEHAMVESAGFKNSPDFTIYRFFGQTKSFEILLRGVS
ncbi:MAG: hypothetical protein LBC56_00070 [Oscillospiraceae bacterium]|nr:hypothetical protein [Oscillospiraceae bacterium]